MDFWELAYSKKWIGIDDLKKVVKTEKNKYGEITPEEFKILTGKEF